MVLSPKHRANKKSPKAVLNTERNPKQAVLLDWLFRGRLGISEVPFSGVPGILGQFLFSLSRETLSLVISDGYILTS